MRRRRRRRWRNGTGGPLPAARKSEPLHSSSAYVTLGPTLIPSLAQANTRAPAAQVGQPGQYERRGNRPGHGPTPTSGLPRASDHSRAGIAWTRLPAPRGRRARESLRAKLVVRFALCAQPPLLCRQEQHCRQGLQQSQKVKSRVKVRPTSHVSLPSLFFGPPPPSPLPKPPFRRQARKVRRLHPARIGASRCVLLTCCWWCCANRAVLLVVLDALHFFCLRVFPPISIWMRFCEGFHSSSTAPRVRALIRCCC